MRARGHSHAWQTVSKCDDVCAFHSRRPIKKCADAIDERSFIRSPLNKYATEGGTERRTVTVGAGRERRERERARALARIYSCRCGRLARRSCCDNVVFSLFIMIICLTRSQRISLFCAVKHINWPRLSKNNNVAHKMMKRRKNCTRSHNDDVRCCSGRFYVSVVYWNWHSHTSTTTYYHTTWGCIHSLNPTTGVQKYVSTASAANRCGQTLMWRFYFVSFARFCALVHVASN